MKKNKTLQNLIERITRLTRLWYEYVSMSHHKSRDCHWYIMQEWAYGEKPKWLVCHEGYIFEGEIIECENYEEALRALLVLIKQAITKEKRWAEEVLRNPNDYYEATVEQARFLKTKLRQFMKKYPEDLHSKKLNKKEK